MLKTQNYYYYFKNLYYKVIIFIIFFAFFSSQMDANLTLPTIMLIIIITFIIEMKKNTDFNSLHSIINLAATTTMIQAKEVNYLFILIFNYYYTLFFFLSFLEIAFYLNNFLK